MTTRTYDKGERRYKHVGNTNEPSFEYDDRNPKKIVGKCPNSVSDADKNRLLQDAISVENGDRDLSVPKQLYAVYNGAIYEAQTSDFGVTYHAYPYRGKLSGRVIALLGDMAEKEACRDEFDRWVKRYIERHGR